MRSRSALHLLLTLVLAAAAAAQAPPATDIHLVPLTFVDHGVEVGAPIAVTDRAGYDNQPAFLPGGETLVYTSIGEDGQADILRYELADGSRSRLVETPESEYSPTPIPGEDAISVVRVEADERQRLWRFPLDGGEPSPVLPDIAPVGYHAWGSAQQLALFVLGEPHTLHHAQPGPGTGKVVASDIGRGLQPMPDKAGGGPDVVTFLHHRDGEGWITRLDLASGEMEPLIEAFAERQDFAWSPRGKLWMADGGKLYRWCPHCGGGWQLVADLAERHGLGNITRLAFHPEGDRLALVADRGE